MTRLQVGDHMPNFVIKTQHHDQIKLYDLLQGQTVFWVLRYIGCTICRYDVHLLMTRYEEFKQRGAQVLVVMQSDQAHIRRDLADEPVPFEIVCDDQMTLYQSLDILPAKTKEALLGDGLAKLQEKGAAAQAAGFSHGDYEGNEQQLPALFIVQEDGTVSYAHYAASIMDMPGIDEVLQRLEK